MFKMSQKPKISDMPEISEASSVPKTKNEIQTLIPKEQDKLYLSAYTIYGSTKKARRQLQETLRRICGWMNKELRTPEIIPSEYVDSVNEQKIKTMEIKWHHLY